MLLTCTNEWMDDCLCSPSGPLQDRRVQSVQPNVLHNRLRNAGADFCIISLASSNRGPLSISVCNRQTTEPPFRLKKHILDFFLKSKEIAQITEQQVCITILYSDKYIKKCFPQWIIDKSLSTSSITEFIGALPNKTGKCQHTRQRVCTAKLWEQKHVNGGLCCVSKQKKGVEGEQTVQCWRERLTVGVGSALQ